MTVLLDDIGAKSDDKTAIATARAPRRTDGPGFRVDRTDAELRKLADDHFEAIVRLLVEKVVFRGGGRGTPSRRA